MTPLDTIPERYRRDREHQLRYGSPPGGPYMGPNSKQLDECSKNITKLYRPDDGLKPESIQPVIDGLFWLCVVCAVIYYIHSLVP